LKSNFLQIPPNDPKTLDFYELNRIFGGFWTIVRNVRTFFQSNPQNHPPSGETFGKISRRLTFAN
jgi:hypothetical protein